MAVFSGDGQSATATPLQIARNQVKPVRGPNEIYVFVLPGKR